WRAAMPDEVDQQSARDDRRYRLRPQLPEPEGSLSVTSGNAAVQLQVLRLVAQRVDVRAGVLAGDQHSGRARPALPPRVVATVQQVRVAGRLVRRMYRQIGRASCRGSGEGGEGAGVG